jgi:BRCT domain type II-containing protein
VDKTTPKPLKSVTPKALASEASSQRTVWMGQSSDNRKSITAQRERHDFIPNEVGFLPELALRKI